MFRHVNQSPRSINSTLPQGRRQTQFQTFQQVICEMEYLHECCYVQNGNWSLSQICLHLRDSLQFALNGYPSISQASVHSRQTCDQDAIKAFAETIRCYDWLLTTSLCANLTVDTPQYGRINVQQLREFELIHAAHHLGFLVPQCNSCDADEDDPYATVVDLEWLSRATRGELAGANY
jgi:Protein of unknown function (DUF1569)